MTTAPTPSSRPVRGTWTVDQVRALGLHTDVPTAGSILGVGRATAYSLVRRGEFPVQVLRLGGRLVVPVSPILRLLGVEDDEVADGDR